MGTFILENGWQMMRKINNEEALCSSEDALHSYINPRVDSSILLRCLNDQQYYYEYLIEMVNSRLDYIDSNLIVSRETKPDRRRLIKDRLIGRGDFSKVYLVYDSETKSKFALKKMKCSSCKELKMDRMLQLFTERDALLTVEKSPFIIHLLDSYLSEDHKSVFFVFEYCPGSFKRYIQLLNVFSLSEFTKTYFRGQLFDKCMEKASELRNFDVSYVNSVYSFELLSAITFLAEKNVVHCDIKFENILISQFGHLKLADLGNVKRFPLFGRHTRHKSTVAEICDRFLQSEDTFKPQGNYIFADPEITHQIYSDLYKDTDLMRNFESLGRTFVKCPDSFYDYEFLSDIFSVGEVIFAMHSNGSVLSFFGSFTYQMIKKHLGEKVSKCDATTLIWRYQIFYDMKTYFEVVYNPLRKIEKIAGISQILIEIFKRRDKRASNISKKKDVWYKNKRRKMLYLDLEIIEKLGIFKKWNINRNTVSEMVLPNSLLELISRSRDSEDENEMSKSDDESSKISQR